MFKEKHALCIMNTKLDDYPLAYQTLKEAKEFITNEQERQLYEDTFIQLYIKLNHPKGYKKCERVMFSSKIWDIQNKYINYQFHFITPLKKTLIKNLSCPTPEYYSVSSPSILLKENGYLCNL